MIWDVADRKRRASRSLAWSLLLLVGGANSAVADDGVRAGPKPSEVEKKAERWMLEELRKEDAKSGAPTYSYYLKLFEAARERFLQGEAITIECAAPVLDEISRMQEPLVSQSELRSFVEARRDSLWSLRVTWNSEVEGAGGMQGPAGHISRQGEFVFKGSKVYYREKHGPSAGSLKEEQTLAYDGAVLRKRFVPEESGQQPLNTEDRFGGLDDFYRPGNPLRESLLVNSEAGFESPFGEFDLVKLVGGPLFIQEKPEVVEGISCVLVTDTFRQVYLATDFGLAPVRYVRRTFRTTSEGDNVKAIDTTHTLTSTEFRDCGDGIVIPFRTEQIVAEGDRIQAKTVTVVTRCEVNSDVDDSLFVNIFPRDSIVHDDIHKVIYAVSKKPSIAGTLDKVIQERSGSRLLLIVVNALVICGVIAYLWIRRTKRRIS